MKKINKSELFKLAWRIFKNAKNAKIVKTFGTALKMAWELSKNAANAISIKRWFLSKNFSRNEQYVIECADSTEVEKETEKAVLVKWVSDYGTLTRWVPKSCIE